MSLGQDEVDYESLPTSSLTVNLMAGALAGITEHSVMYPMDAIKVRAKYSNGCLAKIHPSHTLPSGSQFREYNPAPPSCHKLDNRQCKR